MSTPVTKLEAKKLLDEGHLQEAIEVLVSEVKADPSDNRRRTFLFELLVFNGEWQRAEKHLNILSLESTKAEIGVQAYLNNIKAEQTRQKLCRAEIKPNFLMEPPAYINNHLIAIDKMHEMKFDQARQLLDQADEARPVFSGKLNGKPFTDFRDCYDLVAPVLEIFLKDRYIWLPLQQIKKVQIAPPTQLRDLLWAKADIEAIDGTIGEVFLPTLYAGSSSYPKAAVKLGRLTEWEEVTKDLYVPFGLHMFFVDDQDKTLFEIQTLEFE